MKAPLFAAAVGVMLLAACGGGGSPTATPSATPVTSATPTPLVAEDEAWFRGVVIDMRDGRPVDGPLTMTVRVTDDLGGQTPSVGSAASVFVACSFCIPCQGQWRGDIDKGYNVEVLARWVEGELTTCPSPQLFAAPFGATPTASPVYSGPPTPTP